MRSSHNKIPWPGHVEVDVFLLQMERTCCPAPNIHIFNANPQCGRWGLCEMIRSWGQKPHEWTQG